MAAGVKLATAYVQIVASAAGVRKDVARELNLVAGDAEKTGRSSGKKMSAGLAKGVDAKGFRKRLFSGVDKDAAGAGKRAGGRFKSGMSSALKGFGAGLFVGLGTDQLVGLFKDATKGASDLEQSVGGVQAVFKDFAPQIERASKAAAQSLGLTRNEYNELATTLGAGLKNKGIKDFGKQTQDLIGIGSDLSAQFGGSTQEAVDALASAMRGEMDPIEKYGISLNEAALKAEAVRLGLSDGKGTLEDNVKAQASLSLITKQSADAQGAFAREADTAAGKQARLRASWENLKTTLGEKLLPVVSSVTGAANDFLAGMESGTGVGGKFKEIVSQIAGAVKTAYEWLKPVGSWVVENKEPLAAFVAVLGGFLVINKIVAAVKALSAAFAASPIGWVTIAVAALAAGLVLLYKKNETFRNFVNRAWASIKDAVGKVVAWFKNTAWPWMRDVFTKIGAIAKWLWTNIYRPYFGFILGIAKTVFGWIKNTGWPIMRTALSAIGVATRTLWTKWIKPNFDRMKSGAQALVRAFRSARDGIGTAFSTLKSKISGPIRSVLNWINSNFIGPVNSMLSKVGAGFSIPTLGGGGAKKVGGRSGAQKYATGGHVHGWSPNATADNIPAWLTAGEFVLPVKATDRLRSAIGDGGLEALRRGSLPGYAMGGKVGGLNPSFRRALDGFNAAAGGRFSVISGLRSYAEQVRLYNLYLSGRGNLAAQPGTSRHESGNAADLYPSNARDTHGALARRFGLHFPVPGEAWHVEMIGGMRRMLGGFGKYVGIGNARKVFGGLAGKVIDQGKKALDAILDKRPGGFWSDAIASAIRKITGLITEKVKAAAGAGATSDKEPRGYARGGIVPAVFDNGGTLAPGLNLVHNKLGRPEPLIRPEHALSGPVTVIVRDDSGMIARFVDGRIDTARAHDYRIGGRP